MFYSKSSNTAAGVTKYQKCLYQNVNKDVLFLLFYAHGFVATRVRYLEFTRRIPWKTEVSFLFDSTLISKIRLRGKTLELNKQK